MKNNPLLEVSDLSVVYGRVEATRSVSLAMYAGEFVSIIGSNGAGKSSTLKAIAGVIRPSKGKILLDGLAIQGLPSHEMVKRGIVLVPEGRHVFADQSVEDNLLLGGYLRESRDVINGIAEIYDLFPRLRERKQQLAGSLSGGEQQMLAVARILRTGAKLLLLDEISEGLAPVIVQALARMILSLKSQGYTIVMVEQNFRFAAPLADRFYVMEHGQIVEQFAAAELSSKTAVLNELLGV